MYPPAWFKIAGHEAEQCIPGDDGKYELNFVRFERSPIKLGGAHGLVDTTGRTMYDLAGIRARLELPDCGTKEQPLEVQVKPGEFAALHIDRKAVVHNCDKQRMGDGPRPQACARPQAVCTHLLQVCCCWSA